MTVWKRGAKPPPDGGKEHRKRLREAVETTDREELRDFRRGEHDQEQGKPVHKVKQTGDGGAEGQ